MPFLSHPFQEEKQNCTHKSIFLYFIYSKKKRNKIRLNDINIDGTKIYTIFMISSFFGVFIHAKCNAMLIQKCN